MEPDHAGSFVDIHDGDIDRCSCESDCHRVLQVPMTAVMAMQRWGLPVAMPPVGLALRLASREGPGAIRQLIERACLGVRSRLAMRGINLIAPGKGPYASTHRLAERSGCYYRLSSAPQALILRCI
jgi:hypothetical protein